MQVGVLANVSPPELRETGFKDTTTAYPRTVTRVKARLNTPGQYVRHCHIVEHEDDDDRRPWRPQGRRGLA